MLIFLVDFVVIITWIIFISDELKSCLYCGSPYGYKSSSATYTCPECGLEWEVSSEEVNENPIVKDANGNLPHDGDAEIGLKNLPVKGSSSSIKAGTKLKNIKLTEGDHNTDYKIDGFGAMFLKSEFVRKA